MAQFSRNESGSESWRREGPPRPGKPSAKSPSAPGLVTPLFFIGFGRRGTQPVPGDPALVCLRRFRNLEGAPKNTSPAFADSLGFRETWAARSGSRGLSRETWADDFVRPARSQSKITRVTASHSKCRQLPAQQDLNEYEAGNRFCARYRPAKLRDTRPTELAHRWRSSAWNVFPFIYTNQKHIRSGKNLICAQRGDRMVIPSEGS